MSSPLPPPPPLSRRPTITIPPPPSIRPGGPKTPSGKSRSRANAYKHGLRALIVESPDETAAFTERIDAWHRSFQPTTAAESWLVSNAATDSVRIDRCREREKIALQENVAKAERDWLKRRRAWARRTGALLAEEPEKAFARLTSSAHGCDWLIDRWEDLARDLAVPKGYWSVAEFLRAVNLLGLVPRYAGPTHPVVGPLWQLTLTADSKPDPQMVDAHLGLDTSNLEPAVRAAAQRQQLGEREPARLEILAFVRTVQADLRAAREELWEEVDGPALELACERARTFDPTPEAQLARRYEASLTSSLHRSLNSFFRCRREAGDRDDSKPSGSERYDVVPGSVPAPNELHNGQNVVLSSETIMASESASENHGASPRRPDAVSEASPDRPEAVFDGRAEANPTPMDAPPAPTPLLPESQSTVPADTEADTPGPVELS